MARYGIISEERLIPSALLLTNFYKVELTDGMFYPVCLSCLFEHILERI